MHLLIVGASRGLGRAFAEGLPRPGDHVVGVSRSLPSGLALPDKVTSGWIEADLSMPEVAARRVAEQAPPQVDALIHNVGIWEPAAFSESYRFLEESDATVGRLIDVNITASLLLLKALLPRLLAAPNPRLILTGSTSALPGCGRPEVAFGASKAALNGIASALREGFRAQRLGITTLQLGYLNTDDGLDVPVLDAAARGGGAQVPVHDVVAVVRTLLDLSPASFVRELVMPAILDSRF